MLIFFLIIAMLATAVVLLMGLLNMLKSGQKNKNLSNKYMVWRIWLQGLALIIFAIILYMKGR